MVGRTSVLINWICGDKDELGMVRGLRGRMSDHAGSEDNESGLSLSALIPRWLRLITTENKPSTHITCYMNVIMNSHVAFTPSALAAASKKTSRHG